MLVVILFILTIVLYLILSLKEGWYPTGTYVNTPSMQGIYSTFPYAGRYPYSYGRYAYRRYPRGNPVPLDTIRWGNLFGPMLTSIKSPKDYYIGQWVNAGSAYTDNPDDYTYVSVQQLNLDPCRNFFRYRVITKDGQIIPIYINHDRLEDGDRFKIQGMEGKGDFVFIEADKYAYVYV